MNKHERSENVDCLFCFVWLDFFEWAKVDTSIMWQNAERVYIFSECRFLMVTSETKPLWRWTVLSCAGEKSCEWWRCWRRRCALCGWLCQRSWWCWWEWGWLQQHRHCMLGRLAFGWHMARKMVVQFSLIRRRLRRQQQQQWCRRRNACGRPTPARVTPSFDAISSTGKHM